MDISISRLNNRLALQLPAELPLGLVFVVGYVIDVRSALPTPPQDESTPTVWLDIQEDEYRLRCLLGTRVAAETQVRDGDRIRAGGHLIFDTHRAEYYLLARDVEVIETEPLSQTAEPKPTGRTALTPILADIKKRSEAAQLAQAELPVWVQRIAPPEVQAEMGTGDEKQSLTAVPLPPAATQLNNDLVAFLSNAIEDLEDVELTAAMLEDLAPDLTPGTPHLETTPYEIPPPAPSQHETVAARQDLDWMVLLLILSFIILTIAVIITVFILLLR